LQAAQSSNAATDPQVPGPGLPYPAPKKVAIANAQDVWLALGGGVLFVIEVPSAVVSKFAEILQDFGIQNGRADLVHTHRPLAEIDLAAAVTAEGEVLVGHADEHAAGGAAEKFGGFFLGRHGWLKGANHPLLFSHLSDGVGGA